MQLVFLSSRPAMGKFPCISWTSNRTRSVVRKSHPTPHAGITVSPPENAPACIAVRTPKPSFKSPASRWQAVWKFRLTVIVVNTVPEMTHAG